MNTTENLIKNQVKILYEDLIQTKLFIIEVLRKLKETNENGLEDVNKLEEQLKVQELNVKFIFDKLLGYWIGDIKKEEIVKFLEIVYSQISEVETYFNLKNMYPNEESCK